MGHNIRGNTSNSLDYALVFKRNEMKFLNKNHTNQDH